MFTILCVCMSCPVLTCFIFSCPLTGTEFFVTYIYICIYIYMCVCVCVCVRMLCHFFHNPEIAFYRSVFSEYVVTAYILSYETFTWWIHPRSSIHTSKNLLLDS